jgi:uncharacterized protein YqiB (DUF1249 family)
MLMLTDGNSLRSLDQSDTFAGLMDLYERNYIGLRRLIPLMPRDRRPLRSRVPGGLDLHLQLLEWHRYTTDLTLTYLFERSNGLRAEPDLQIRIYHDARQAEVMSAHLRHWPEFAAEHCPGLHARWRANRFLWKWLNYCLYQGHCFDVTAPVPTGAAVR